eukprot:TRINITY_DN2501_c0_g1_i7.p1 TRINITY_DN2501_c0_g1~~TRINITY_DN2501_c0_g1_i7.p1  ORF type:complete len:231 (+),score=76.25 TRINITY_DN2501_c0_g1_i7:144-836(+)
MCIRDRYRTIVQKISPKPKILPPLSIQGSKVNNEKEVRKEPAAEQKAEPEGDLLDTIAGDVAENEIESTQKKETIKGENEKKSERKNLQEKKSEQKKEDILNKNPIISEEKKKENSPKKAETKNPEKPKVSDTVKKEQSKISTNRDKKQNVDLPKENEQSPVKQEEEGELIDMIADDVAEQEVGGEEGKKAEVGKGEKKETQNIVDTVEVSEQKSQFILITESPLSLIHI